ncbi:uncharacterized protein TNCV_630041 [Trichonephila clavipes]|nr:uncharacterized protein TNCV_630041 [Trichonephila clavipes]
MGKNLIFIVRPWLGTTVPDHTHFVESEAADISLRDLRRGNTALFRLTDVVEWRCYYGAGHLYEDSVETFKTTWFLGGAYICIEAQVLLLSGRSWPQKVLRRPWIQYLLVKAVMATKAQSAPGSSDARLKSSWKQLLFGALFGSGGLSCYLLLNSQSRPSKWMLAPILAGSAGLTLVNLAVMDMSESSRECSENMLNQKLSESETVQEEFSEDESISANRRNSLNFKRLFIKFLEVNFDMNTESVRKIFSTKCSECKTLERNTSSMHNILELTETISPSGSEPGGQETNSNIKIDFPKKITEVASSRLYFLYRGNVTREAGLLKNKITLLLSEFNKLVEHSINPEMPKGDPSILHIKKQQDEYGLPSTLDWKSHVITAMLKGIINHLQFKLLVSATHFERTIINKWEKESENLRFEALVEAFGVLTGAEATYVQERGTQTDFVYCPVGTARSGSRTR